MSAPTITDDLTGTFVTWWNTVFAPWLNANATGSSDSSFATAWTLNGRVLTSMDDAFAPVLPGSPALTVIIPSGATLVLAGQLIELEDDTAITGISANFSGWIVPIATFDVGSESYVWTHSEYTVRPAIGSGVICYVNTSNSAVTTIKTDALNCDIIPTMPYLMQIVETLQAQSGGGSGPSQFASTLPISPANSGDTLDYVNAQDAATLAAAEAAASAAIAAGGTLPVSSPDDQVAHNVALLIKQAGLVDPLAIEEFEGAFVRADNYGDGTADTPNFIVASTMTEGPDGWSPA